MDHNYYYLISYSRWKNHMIKISAIILWADHIKSPLTMLSLNLHGLQIWPHFLVIHQRLLLMITINPHILLQHMRIPSELNLLSIWLYKFNLHLRLQPRIKLLNLVTKHYIRNMYNPFPSVLSILFTKMKPIFHQYHLHQHQHHTKIGHNLNHWTSTWSSDVASSAIKTTPPSSNFHHWILYKYIQ